MDLRSRAGPVVEALALMAIVSLTFWVVGATARSLAFALFVLGPGVANAPWTLVTSVYAHAGPGHLAANAVLVGLAGLAVGRTSRARFHATFVGCGALAGLAQIAVGVVVGSVGVVGGGAAGVVGASGAAFALVGYVVVANPASRAVSRWVGPSSRVVVAAVALVALGLTLLLSAAGSALVAHFVGAVLGGLLGRWRVLEPGV